MLFEIVAFQIHRTLIQCLPDVGVSTEYVHSSSVRFLYYTVNKYSVKAWQSLDYYLIVLFVLHTVFGQAVSQLYSSH